MSRGLTCVVEMFVECELQKKTVYHKHGVQKQFFILNFYSPHYGRDRVYSKTTVLAHHNPDCR